MFGQLGEKLGAIEFRKLGQVESRLTEYVGWIKVGG